MTYYIDEHQGSAYVNPGFPVFTDTLGTCGSPKYSVTIFDPSVAAPIITIPAGTNQLTVATSDMTLIGTYEVEVLIELDSYPELTPVVGVTQTVQITIDHRCLHTVFSLDGNPFWPLLFQQIGEFAPTYTINGVQDSVSLANGNNDGYTYCGERTYTTRLVGIDRFVNQLGTVL